jgi:acetyltransferase-like isoleucine patch superfamily enzyme
MIGDSVFIHELSEVSTNFIGSSTSIWQFCVVLSGAKIGSNVNICSHCFIENDVFIGNNVTIKNGNHLYDGLVIENNVFIGPGVIFTNDKYPRSKQKLKSPLKTYIQSGATIGAGAIILPGITIGKNAMIAAGAVVTKNVPEETLYLNELISKSLPSYR